MIFDISDLENLIHFSILISLTRHSSTSVLCSHFQSFTRSFLLCSSSVLVLSAADTTGRTLRLTLGMVDKDSFA